MLKDANYSNSVRRFLLIMKV